METYIERISLGMHGESGTGYAVWGRSTLGRSGHICRIDQTKIGDSISANNQHRTELRDAVVAAVASLPISPEGFAEAQKIATSLGASVTTHCPPHDLRFAGSTGRELLYERYGRKLTQCDVAQEAGIKTDRLSELELCVAEPTAEEVAAICRALVSETIAQRVQDLPGRLFGQKLTDLLAAEQSSIADDEERRGYSDK